MSNIKVVKQLRKESCYKKLVILGEHGHGHFHTAISLY